MKIRFNQEERLLVHRLFDFLAFSARRNRDEKKRLEKISNRFYGPAPQTNLKPEEATLVFVAINYALQRDVDKKHPNRAVFESIAAKLVPGLTKEKLVDETTGIRGFDPF